MKTGILALAAVLLSLAPAAADDPKPGGRATIGAIVVEGAWVRGAPPGAPVAAGYLTVTNTGEAAERLVGGSVPFADRVEIHEMTMADGMMRMTEIPGGLRIAPGESEELAPGGTHLMFMDLTEAPAPGETVPVTLEFAEAGAVTVEMPVSAIGATALSPD